MDPAFLHDQYIIKRQFLSLTGKFRIFDSQGKLVLYSQQKILRLKEDIRVYNDDSMSQELLRIQAQQVVDFSAAYNVIDTTYQSRIGILRRKGFRSMLRDEWEILDTFEKPKGILIEDNKTMAFLRRILLGSLLPQNYDLLIGESCVAYFRQHFNLLRYVLDLDFRMDTNNLLDRRLGIALAILVGTIEGRQSN